MRPTLVLVSLKTDGPAQEGRIIELRCPDWWVLPMRWITRRWRTETPSTCLDSRNCSGSALSRYGSIERPRASADYQKEC